MTSDALDALLAAQAKLMQLRQSHNAIKEQVVTITHSVQESATRGIKASALCLDKLPAHLGWESQAVSRSLRHTPTDSIEEPPLLEETSIPFLGGQVLEEPVLLKETPSLPPKTVVLYPDIAVAWLARQMVAPARLWLLARLADERGQGWLSLEELGKKFCDAASAFRFVGKRQLRNLLKQGEEIFWTCRHNRLWLRSTVKVAAALGIEKFKQVAVKLPVAQLLEKISVVRAYFYATFHSSRACQPQLETQFSPPIARQTLKKITHLSRQTQRRYERLAKIRTLANFAVGHPLTPEREQIAAAQYGNALFHLTDYAGTHGRAGITYLAWQLPNSYGSGQLLQPLGRKRRLNRKLAVLWQKGTAGNDKSSGANQRRRQTKRFFKEAVQATKSYNRSPNQTVYWASSLTALKKQLGTRAKRTAFWYVLPAVHSNI